MKKDIKIVCGANAGDEGKGMMVDYFSHLAQTRSENCIVVCANGGPQRGHTVTTPEGNRHIFRHLGSGTFTGADTYLAEKFIVNPILFRQEYEEMVQVYGIVPQVFVHPNCMVTTPFDMMINQIIEEHRGENRHGSCGCGIWETIVRDGKCLSEMAALNHFELRKYISIIQHKYLPKRLRQAGISKVPESWLDITKYPNFIWNYAEDFNFFLAHTVIDDDTVLLKYQNIIFENGQGLLLDQSNKEYGNHTTPSSTGVKNPAEIINNLFLSDADCTIETCYVSRTYMTRHGAGPMDRECSREEIGAPEDQTNVPNEFQGSLRYGKLDVNDLHKRIHLDFEDFGRGKISLALTHVTSRSDKWPFEDCVQNFDMPCYISTGLTREKITEIGGLRFGEH